MNMLKNNELIGSEVQTRSWTEQDKYNLLILYPSKTNKELCEILEKTEGQLRGMKERLRLNKKIVPFTEEEKNKIQSFYKNNPNELDLDCFSNKLGRQKTSISRYAKKLGLTKSQRPISDTTIEKSKKSLLEYRKTFKYLNDIHTKQSQLLTYYAKNKHPKGMLNKHHNCETRNKMSSAHIALSSKMSTEYKHAIAMKAVETKRKNNSFGTTSNAYSRCKGGFRKDIQQYFRSSWEANLARVLNYNNIVWEYEIKRFNFTNSQCGVLSYQPDFYLPKYNKWIEVKGWMDEKSKKRLELFQEYYPIEYSNLILVDEQLYRAIKRNYYSCISNWE